MKWRQPASRSVVEAVIEVFGLPSVLLRQRLAALSLRQWITSYYWLDASGIALYFLERVRSLDLESFLPPLVLDRLQQNQEDSRARSESMFHEFGALNRAFQQAGIGFCNLKGFTLSPHACADPAMRCQLDFDFLVGGRDLQTCRALLEERGYVLRGVTDKAWEFKTDCDELADIADFYKPKPQRCVELHFAPSAATYRSSPSISHDKRLDHMMWTERDGLLFAGLNYANQFVGQATHLFAHLCGSSTRLSWLLEFAYHLEARREDADFWNEVHSVAPMNANAEIAIGVTCMLASDLFHTEIPIALRVWTVDRLPEGIALWVECYGRRAMLADFPGTKLNLLLLDELHAGDNEWRHKKRNSLVPRHRAPRIVYVAPGSGIRKRLRSEVRQLRYDMFRLRFHFVEGFRYAVEAARWRRHRSLHCVFPLPSAHNSSLSNT